MEGKEEGQFKIGDNEDRMIQFGEFKMEGDVAGMI